MQFLPSRKEPQLPAVEPAHDDHDHAMALAVVTRLRDEVKHLREDSAKLRAELNIIKMRNQDLEVMLREMRYDMESYRRYSVTVQTHLRTIVDVVQRANEEALNAGVSVATDQIEKANGAVEEVVKKYKSESESFHGD